jgi:hypothetical protein
VFGALWVTQAALPFLRAQRSGHIIQVSSIGGITAFQNVGIYHASKWALEGFSQALAQEVAPFGIHVTLIEPGGFSTDWAGSSSRSAQLADYKAVHEEADRVNAQRASPAVLGRRLPLLKVVDAEPPLRVSSGAAAAGLSDYENWLKTWEEWQPVAVEARARRPSGRRRPAASQWPSSSSQIAGQVRPSTLRRAATERWRSAIRWSTDSLSLASKSSTFSATRCGTGQRGHRGRRG